MIKNIFEFLENCLWQQSTDTAITIGLRAGILTLRHLYDLNVENKAEIVLILRNKLKIFFEPEDVMCGLLLMEHQQFCLLISLLYQLFCTSSVECLPSILIADYLLLFLQLHFRIPDSFMAKQQVGTLIIRYLDNCKDLACCVQQLYSKNYADNWKQLHSRIGLALDESHTAITIKIVASSAITDDFSISLALPNLLMANQYNHLTFRIFMLLLEQLASLLKSNRTVANVDLLQTEGELEKFISINYTVKLEILYTLDLLVSHDGLRSQLSEHNGEYLKFVGKLINYRLNLTSQNNDEEIDQFLIMLLLVCQEFLQQAKFIPDSLKSFEVNLQKLRRISKNELLQERIDSLLPFIRGEFNFVEAEAKNSFNTARTLIESNESHLQVYGLQMLLNLLRRKDKVTHLNKHVIIALALNALRAKESYTFLNCVRVFVTLVYYMEAEVLELLCDEYVNENSAMDYRLVVGEALLKVCKEIGPLCYKYKDVLINCFLNGARSLSDEFRMSSFTNLAQLCKLLCYQVHRFFNELLNIIDIEVSSGKYLPAKRAAILVLSELLEGMDNLLDFEEMLLPLYRFLKLIESNLNADQVMRIHAANGLKVLNEKCRKLFTQEQTIEKKITITNIKENKGGKYKKHILELN